MNAVGARLTMGAQRITILIALLVLAVFASGTAGYFIRGAAAPAAVNQVRNAAATSPAGCAPHPVGDRCGAGPSVDSADRLLAQGGSGTGPSVDSTDGLLAQH